MGSSVFGIGVSGLNAANIGLTVTGHNISNVNTPGYSRQIIQQSAPYPLLSGSGFTGLGVHVDSIRRIYDEYQTRAVQTAQTQTSYLDTLNSHLSEVDDIIADPTAGVSPALQDFFKSVQDVSTNPADTASRQAMISSGQSLVNRLNTFDTRLNEMAVQTDGEITNTVSTINGLSAQIAELNKQISSVNGLGQPPNDLLDQRDALVLELNKYVKGTTISQTDGSINVFIGNGQNLVVGGNAFTLAAVPSPSDPQKVTIAYQQNANTIYLPESQLTGGSLQGLLTFRNSGLAVAKANLNQVALTVAQTVNDQMRAGQDLYNNIGQNFFNFQRASTLDTTLSGATVRFTASGTTIPSSDFSIAYDSVANSYTLTRLTDNQTQAITPAQMAAGFTAFGVTVQLTAGVPAASATTGMSFPPAIGAIRNNTNNTGSGQIGGYISDVNQMQTSDYELGYDGTNYVLTRLKDGVKTSYATLPINQDGLHLELTGGTINAGDRFTIKPTEGFINSMSVRTTDPREIAAAAPMAATPSNANTGTLKVYQPTSNLITTNTTDSAINPAIRNPIQIKFTSTNTFDVIDVNSGTNISTGNAYTAGMTVSVNGWNMKLDGQPANGDVVDVKANTGGSADNRNALAMAALQTSKLMFGGTATYQDAYSAMVANIGTQTNQTKIQLDAQQIVLQNAQTARNDTSGVNLDEEAANLLRYQQAYQASSKVIQIANQAFQSIASIV
ncbi:flagellar hook-associated protein 1 FlgK [Andreprevotia lacus DSM 23236]|jgi:flagellar hook-associated protein 1 FlgK|uniref:Flagellar hook-associated protein 1 n=1 Tax=Andreprevotia lacus DSM 23236 TaxID=1121001 RepID=A0A1W1WZ22_9NEIS|nr:flagellar hook-associated protein FlgK [Andreprevotia lacus]SMC16863.1 flagellar hook-associated protein 1 FlgK [Andreprevotia lacus DSM 23236]